MIVLFEKDRFIVPRRVERVLQHRSLWDDETDAPSDPLQKAGGMHIDLARAEWVDVAALTHLIILAEAVLRHGLRVSLTLPDPAPSEGEAAILRHPPNEQAANAVRHRMARRERTHSILQHLKWVQACAEAAERHAALSRFRVMTRREVKRPEAEISAPPRAEGTSRGAVREDYRPPNSGGAGLTAESLNPLSTPAGAPREEEDEEENERRLDDELRQYAESANRLSTVHFMTPFRWVAVDEASRTEALMRELTRVLQDPQRGIRAVHAQALANVVFHELLDNVAAHSQHATHALVVGWARPTTKSLVTSGYEEQERGFFDWVRTNDTPMLEVVVADAGCGVQASLRAPFEKSEAAARSAPSKGPWSRRDARVLAWAWERWSTRLTETRAGTRGLYRVDRVVNMYQGLALLRAGREAVGWDHGGRTFDQAVISPRRLAQMPGTMIRLYLPAMGIDAAAPRATVMAMDEAKVDFVHAKKCEIDGLRAGQRDEIQRLLVAADPAVPHCVVVQFDPGDGDIEHVLRDAAALRHPALLVLGGLARESERTVLGIAKVVQESTNSRAYDEAREAANTTVWDPILVILPNGGAQWTAAHETQATVLNALLGTDTGTLNAERIRALVPNDAERDDMYRRARLDRTAIRLDEHSGSMSLRVQVPTLLAGARARLSEFVEGEVAKRRNRERLTPTLRFTRTWIDFHRALRLLGIEDVVFLGLSIALAGFVDQARRRGTVLLGDTGSHRGMLERLAGFLGAEAAVHLPHYAAFELPRQERLMDAGKQVIIHCDVIVSGASVRRCVKQVLRDGGSVLAVSCFVDARDDASEPLLLWPGEPSVPVVRSIHAPVMRGTGTGDYDSVSPITGLSEVWADPARTPDEPPAIARDLDVGEALLAAGAVHFSHIARPHGRHFTLWMDQRRVLAIPLVRMRIREAFRAWYVGLPGGERSMPQVTIWYPTSADDEESPLAELAGWLAEAEAPRVRGARAIARVAVAGRWRFPDVDTLSMDGAPILVLDWGAFDGTSISSLLDLAAGAGATHAFACVVVGQLPVDSAAFFQDLSELTTERPSATSAEQLDLLQTEAPAPSRTHRMAVRVRFITTFAPGVFQHITCPVCAQAAELRDLRPEDESLREFVHQKVDHRLRARRPSGARGMPLGVDDVAIGPEEMRAILRWKLWLDEALGSTRSRFGLLKRVEEIADAVTWSPTARLEAKALLHVLSVESHWVRLPPLEFEPGRAALALIARRIALDPSESGVVRLHALIVYRVTDKLKFVDDLAILFEACTADAVLIGQLLFSTFAYLARPYHHSQPLLAPLRTSLRRLVSALDEHRFPLVTKADEFAVRGLADRAAMLFGHSSARNVGLAGTWLLMSDVLLHHEVARKAIDTFQQLEPDKSYLHAHVLAHARGRDPVLTPASTAWLQELAARWKIVREWILGHVLPLVRTVLPVMSAADFSLAPELVRWFRAQSDSTVGLVDLLDTAIGTMLSTRGAPPTPEVWSEYKARWNWWATHLIAVHGTSTMTSWFAEAPADVAAAVTAVQRRVSLETAPITVQDSTDMQRDVFFPQAALGRLLGELAMLVHASYQEVFGGDAARLHMTVVTDRPTLSSRVSLTLEVRPDRPLPSGVSPGAIASENLDDLRTSLAFFNGTLRYERGPDREPRYTLEFLKVSA